MLTPAQQQALTLGVSVILHDQDGPYRGFVLRREGPEIVIEFEDGLCFAVPVDDERLTLA